MNELISINQSITSMQISEIIGKRHDNVMRDIRDETEKLHASGISTDLKFALSERTDPTGRKIPYYILSKEGVSSISNRLNRRFYYGKSKVLHCKG